MLRMLEDPAVVLRDMTLENPIRAIREISHDITCRRKVRLANGREVSAFDIQSEYLERALRFAETNELTAEESRALQMWEHVMAVIGDDPLKLDREVDWVIKHKLLTEYGERNGVGFDDPHIALLDLQYHHVHSTRGVFYLMQRRGLVERVLDDADVRRATEEAPQTTRARLRGAFVREAKARRRDYTVRLGAPEAQRPGPSEPSCARTRSAPTTSAWTS